MNNNPKNAMILNQYPKNQFNSLIPVASLQEVNDLHKIIVNQVKLDMEEDSYPESGKRALNKAAILKLMAAANIQMIDSTPIQPSTIADAIAMAKATGQAQPYDKRDTAHKVTLRVPDTNGGFRMVTGTKEIIIDELQGSAAKIKAIVMHRRALCETKALLRAARAAMTLKSTYVPADFEKPFIVAIVVPNAENETVKKAIADNFAKTNSLMFGTSDEPLAIGHNIDNDAEPLPENAEADIVIPADEMPEILRDDLPPEPHKHWCEAEGCGQEITAYGKNSVEDIIARSQQMFGKDYCFSCLKAKAAQNQ